MKIAIFKGGPFDGQRRQIEDTPHAFEVPMMPERAVTARPEDPDAVVAPKIGVYTAVVSTENFVGYRWMGVRK